MPTTSIGSLWAAGSSQHTRSSGNRACSRLLKTVGLFSKYHHHAKETRQGHSLPTLGVPRAAQVFYQGPNVAASAKGAAAQQERLCPQTAGLIKASPLPDYSGTLAHHKNVNFDSCLSWQKARTLVRTIKHCSNCAQCQHETVGWLTRGSKR